MAERAMGVVLRLKHPRPGQQSQELSPTQELVRRQVRPPHMVHRNTQELELCKTRGVREAVSDPSS